MVAGKPRSFPDAILRFMGDAGDCLIWTGPEKNGYGYVYYKGKNYRVHKLLWEIQYGPVPDGYVLDHECRNKLCVRMHHLKPKTSGDNTRAFWDSPDGEIERKRRIEMGRGRLKGAARRNNGQLLEGVGR